MGRTPLALITSSQAGELKNLASAARCFQVPEVASISAVSRPQWMKTSLTSPGGTDLIHSFQNRSVSSGCFGPTR